MSSWLAFLTFALALDCGVAFSIHVADAARGRGVKRVQRESGLECTVMARLHDDIDLSDLVGSSGTGTDGVCSLQNPLPGDGNLVFVTSTHVMIARFHNDTDTCHKAQMELEGCTGHVDYAELDGEIRALGADDSVQMAQAGRRGDACTLMVGLREDSSLEQLVGSSGTGTDGVCSLPTPLPEDGITYLEAMHLVIVNFNDEIDACHKAQQALAACSEHVKHAEFDGATHIMGSA